MEPLVRSYWEREPCGAKLSSAGSGTDAFFDDTERARDRLEPFIRDFARFDDWRGRDVLEIGTGTGVDLVRFARAGAHVSGVDLTEAGASLTRSRLAREGLAGDVRSVSGEELPFADATFDLVYSWGVIHHAEHPERIVAEIRRVLRHGGSLVAMVYHRRSWFALGVWGRVLAGGRLAGPRAAIAQRLESPGTRAYTRAEARRLFAPVGRLEITTVATPYDARLAGPLARLTPQLGWFLVVSARNGS
jgi:SAM-dependent methyltransferase